MKINLKTLNQKTVSVEIEETKTVYDLKKELSLYPDIGVKPEFQKLIYSGKILNNNDVLSTCNIDTKKYLVVMVLKKPMSEDAPSTSAPSSSDSEVKKKAENVSDEKPEEKKPKVEEPKKEEAKNSSSKEEEAKEKTENLVQHITSMGYVESDVRAALLASYNNPERAIEYLIEGRIPNQGEDMDYDLDEEEISPFELFRHDPLFRQLRSSVIQNPELINDAIARIAEANPSFMDLIDENHEQFMRVLLDTFDDESDGESDLG